MRRVLAFEFLHCAGNVSILVGMPFQGGLAAENILAHTLKLKRQPQTNEHKPISLLDLILSSRWLNAERIIQFGLFNHCERLASTIVNCLIQVMKPRFDTILAGDLVS